MQIKNEVAAAHSLWLSYRKYKVFLELQTLDPNIAIEDIMELTMRQIRDMINALSNDVNNPTPDSDKSNRIICKICIPLSIYFITEKSYPRIFLNTLCTLPLQ